MPHQVGLGQIYYASPITGREVRRRPLRHPLPPRPSAAPYPAPNPSTTPYPMYKDYKDYKDSSYPGMTSSIASLRLKAKQHQSGFSSYSPQPPLSPRSSSLSACQYTGAPDRPVL